MAAMMSVCSVSHAVTLNFSVTIDQETLKSCDEPLCKLISNIYELHSRDIENMAASYSTKNTHALTINVNITHDVSIWEKTKEYAIKMWKSVNFWENENSPNKVPVYDIKPNPAEPELKREQEPKPEAKPELKHEPEPKRDDVDVLLQRLKGYCGDNLDRRSDMRFIIDCTPDLSLDTLIKGLVSEDLSRYEEGLRKQLRVNDGEIEFILSKSDERLNMPDISRDDCLRVFLEHITGYRKYADEIKDTSDILDVMKSDSLLENFRNPESLERIDYVDKVNDAGYFREGILNFCEVPRYSPAAYVFIDGVKFRDVLKEIYGGELEINGTSSFSFRRLHDKEANITSEKISLSLNSLKSYKAEHPRVYGERLDIARYFFRTDHEGVYLVVIPEDSRGRRRYFIAGNQAIFNSDSLNEALRDSIREDYESERVTFTLWKPEATLSGRSIDECIDIFIGQLFEQCQIYF